MPKSLYSQAKTHVIRSRGHCDKIIGHLGAIEQDYLDTEPEIAESFMAATTAAHTLKEMHSHLLLMLTGMVKQPDRWKSPDDGDTGSDGFNIVGGDGVPERDGDGDSPPPGSPISPD